MQPSPPHAGPTPPPWGVRLGRFLARLLGWEAVGALPPVPKAIFVASPHTTLWDGPIMVIIAWAIGVRLSFITKKETFRFPFKRFVTYFGGIPVDRSRKQDMVGQVVEQFQQRDGMYLAVAPDGTRKRAAMWRSGFYHMARGADVPLILGFLDYRQKRGGILETYHLTGDLQTDMDHIRAAYAGISGKYPALTSEIRLRDEGAETAAPAAPAAR